MEQNHWIKKSVEEERKSASEFFNDPLFRLTKVSLMIIGRWPYQDRRLRTIICFSINFGILTVVVPEVIHFIEVFKDIKLMIECLMALMVTYVAYVMILNSIINFNLMEETLEELRKSWTDLRTVNEITIFQKYMEEGKFWNTLYAVAAGSSLITFLSVPLLPRLLDLVQPLNESRPLKPLLEVQYYIDHSKYYLPIYLHNVQAAIGVIVIVVGLDLYFITIVQHVCSMFAVLGSRINSISEKHSKIYKTFSISKHEKLLHKDIVECIIYHRKCVRYVHLIENSMNISWLLQIFLNVLFISVCGVQTLTLKDEPEKMFSFGMNTISSIARLAYISWNGQKIINHSTRIQDLINNTHWYEFPLKTQKVLMFMMLQVKPSYITAGKVAVINFSTYATLMKTSVSYFTMILSTQ